MSGKGKSHYLVGLFGMACAGIVERGSVLELARVLQRYPTSLLRRGIVHITNSGSCSRFEFAKEVLQKAGWKTPVLPITTAEADRLAKRPAYSVLSCASLAARGITMTTWQKAVDPFFAAHCLPVTIVQQVTRPCRSKWSMTLSSAFRSQGRSAGLEIVRTMAQRRRIVAWTAERNAISTKARTV